MIQHITPRQQPNSNHKTRTIILSLMTAFHWRLCTPTTV